MKEFITNNADGTAGEARQTRNGHSPKTFQHLLNHGKAISHDRISSWFGIDVEFCGDLAVFEDLDTVAVLADDCSRIATNKGIAPDVFATFDRLKEERFALAADLSIRRKRCIKIGKQTAGDWNQIPVQGQLA